MYLQIQPCMSKHNQNSWNNCIRDLKWQFVSEWESYLFFPTQTTQIWMRLLPCISVLDFVVDMPNILIMITWAAAINPNQVIIHGSIHYIRIYIEQRGCFFKGFRGLRNIIQWGGTRFSWRYITWKWRTM